MQEPRKTIVVDIDGTLCPLKKPTEEYKDLVPFVEVIFKLKEYRRNGFEIILHTSRNMRTYNGDVTKILQYTQPVLESWLDSWQIPYDKLIVGKPWAGDHGFYIDDRSVRPREWISNSFDQLNNLVNLDRLQEK